ncbi:MAG TPA: SusD/RagB family nutrient-binding outer membrane lipoprotein [Chitinophagaceae bacterium]|nr:SusD/RagB family nutrient-binding outer membrane lipoprotein [Chitinophagaceae bacterium]
MKNKLYSLLFLSLVFSGCKKFSDGINKNPNQPSTASGTQLIANAELFLPGLSTSPLGEFHAQYLGETQYPGASLYPDGGTSFYSLYQGPLMNLETVLNSNELSGSEGPVPNQLAVAKILKAYFFWHITDRWGDVPYSEALLGEADFTPKYDSQQSIYDALFTLLDEANAQIVPGNILNDIIYAGDMTKWKKLANTIHMLMALRLSEVDATKGAAEFNKALTNGIMTSNADNFVFKHLSDATNQSYWYGQVVNQNREWWALTETLVNYMLPDNDPRLAVFAKKTTGGIYKGIEFGTTVGLPNTTGVSLIGPAIYAQNAQIALVTYAQALFAKAEAAKRGWIPGGDAVAKTNYDLAIEQSMRQWTGGTTGLATFMASPDIVYDPANALKQIAMQRYVHLFMHGFEAWAEYRRTGFPDNLVKPGGRNIPARHSYPSNEAFTNEANYKEAITRAFAGKDDLFSKVWWDK